MKKIQRHISAYHISARFYNDGGNMLFICSMAFLVGLGSFATSYAQETKVDEIGQQASQLEAELGKYKDTSPEAADTLVKLVDLYHSHARAFGLIRAGQKFTASHPGDPRHQAVMLKLIDGLEAMSRNRDLTVACRQFMAKYPKAPQRKDVAQRLAFTLDKLNERVDAAKVYRSLWEMQPAAAGRDYGYQAVLRFTASGNRDDITAGAELAEQMFDKLPAGAFSEAVGLKAVEQWERINEWAKANLAAKKLLAKGMPKDRELLRSLHRRVAENYARQRQYANAVDSLKQVRRIRNDQESHYQLIQRMYNAAVKAVQLQPVVDEYSKKYPRRDDRFYTLGLLAYSYGRDGDGERARQLFREVMMHQAATHSAASNYVRYSGSEPKDLAEIEKDLRAAIRGPEQQDAYYAKYILGFSLYRDRIKDPAKARAVLREMVTDDPPNDGNSWNAISYLLDTAEQDAEYKADVDRLVAARQKYIHLSSYRQYLPKWLSRRQAAIEKAKGKKDPDREQISAWDSQAKYLSTKLDQSNADPVVAGWSNLYAASGRDNQAKARAVLLAPGLLAKQSPEQVRILREAQAYYLRRYVPSNQRVQCVDHYGQLAKSYPQDYRHAINYLAAATDYAPPEVQKEAALHLLKIAPEYNNADAWRRLMIAADKNQDDKLVRQALAYALNSQKQFGDEPRYATQIGDMLLKYELEAEAVAYWNRGLTVDRNHSESYQCADRLLNRIEEESRAEKIKFIQELLSHDTDHHGRYSFWLAQQYAESGDAAKTEQVLRASKARQAERPFRSWGIDVWALHYAYHAVRDHEEIDDAAKLNVTKTVADLEVDWPSAQAELALAEVSTELSPMQRLLAYQRPSRQVHPDAHRWDQLMPYAQAAFNRGEYTEAATLVTGMLTNITGAGTSRQKSGRDMVARCYARIGSVGLTIDETSPAAPLLQAALYLRLGDEKMAFDAYLANRQLFDKVREELPSDLVLFICNQLIAAGGQENHDKVEEILRGWIIANSESKQVDDKLKAQFQLLLAKNYFRSQRYDVARSEFTTVMNRYPDTPEATEAEFGIGETFMAQKVFDQAERVLEKLAGSQDLDIVVRAEFLRGVLSFRRGDHDEARDIFRSVLERSPNIDLADQTLFNLSEVFGAEERYLDQLNLLRTVGRLGRQSKRRHRPGMPLSIVVHDSDLGISRGHSRIEVIVTTEPGGDQETVYLTSGGASKGLFRVDVDTQLGDVEQDDGVLQLTGNDIVRCDYPDQFKKEFKRVPLSDVEIRIASDAKFDIASSKIVDEEKESFAERLEREAREREEADQRVSQGRPANQVKPGNLIYLRVQDPDRDLTGDIDRVVVKLAADSGDQVQFPLQETGSHSGVFEGQVRTGELPAGALATDMAIEHSPLMAIDRDKKSYWMSEPDGAAPKSISVDMKDLKSVSRVTITSPQADNNAPVRADLLGSQDGEFWFRIASHPTVPEAAPVAKEYGRMQQRVFAGNYTRLTQWQQVVDLGMNGQPVEESVADELSWGKEADDPQAAEPFAVIWHGKLPQPRTGAVRLQVHGQLTAIAVDGRLELPFGPSGRTVDLWLESGLHDLTIFAATGNPTKPLEAAWAQSDYSSTQVVLRPFQATDFDLSSAGEADQAVVGTATIHPITLTMENVEATKKTEEFGVRPEYDPAYIWNWKDLEDSLSWQVDVAHAGVYEVWIEQAHPAGGSKFRLQFDDQTIDGTVEYTGGWANKFRNVRFGGIAVEKPGRYTLLITPVEIASEGLMDLRSVTLKPTKASVAISGNEWRFNFDPLDLRYVRLKANEYRGEAVSISNIEVAGDEVHIPTEDDVLKLATNQVLEIAGGDVVTASYTDEFTQTPQGASRLLTSELTATYFNAEVNTIAYDFIRSPNGAVNTIPKRLLRVEPSERIIVQITDYDEDQTAQKDTVEFEVTVNDGEPVRLTATETEEYSGIFTREVDTSATPAEGKLTVKPGDRVYCRYFDRQNTFPGHSVPRESVVYVNQPTEGLVRILESRVTPPPPDSNAQPRTTYTVPAEEQMVSGVAFEAPLTVEVIDPDAAKDSRSTVAVLLKTSDGATVEVDCEVSSAFDESVTAGFSGEDYALEKGRFIGQVILQLGGKDSPTVVPLSSEMPRNLIGGPKTEEDGIIDNLTAHVLNVTGKDLIAAGYQDKRRPDGSATVLASRGRLIVNGELACTGQDYEKPIEHLHVGEKLYLRVTDADRDSSDERDMIELEVTAKSGEKETVSLAETLAHSGVFTGSLMLKASEKPTPENLDPADPTLETYFGDTLTVRYVDPAASTESGELESTLELPVVIGTNGLVSAFTKVFNDEALAIETKFHIAESYFELFKSHRELERKDEETSDLEAGRRILNEVMEDYPDPKYAPRVAYLLGQFAQELEQWGEAIRSYDLIIRQYPDHVLAPDAQYKLAQCYEEAGDFDQALEGYVTLAATYPKSPLIASVMIRISDYFYKNENYDVASQVGEKFLEKFKGHEHAAKMAFRIGQCHYKGKQYMDAGEAFDNFAKLFPDDKLAADAMFWAGESYRQGNQNSFAFRRYNNCRWKFPASEAAKYARGRLALPEMLQQFEAEAASVDQ